MAMTLCISLTVGWQATAEEKSRGKGKDKMNNKKVVVV